MHEKSEVLERNGCILARRYVGPRASIRARRAAISLAFNTPRAFVWASPKALPPPAPLPWGVVVSMLHKKQKALTKPRPHPRPLSHGERGACFIKNKKPSPKPTKSPGQKQKTSPNPDLTPGPMGRGGHASQKQKPPPNPQKSSTFTTPQASPPHEMRKGHMA